MISFPLTAMQEAAKWRPAGYLDDCLAAGTLSEDKLHIHFTEEQYDALTEKYRGNRPLAERKSSPAPEPGLGPATHGPGTELKKLLAKVGITATENCSCNSRARRMDENEAREPGWCEAHLDEIVGWLREEATKRKLPFLDAAGRLLIRRAIANARRAASG